VLVVVEGMGLLLLLDRLLRQEKDEASQSVSADWDSLKSSFSNLRGLKTFLFGLRSGLSIVNPLRGFREAIERSVMSKIRSVVLALSSLCISLNLQAQYAAQVISYDAGIGFTPGFTNAAAAIGKPSGVTPGAFGGPVDPFDPPYLSSQLVSVGAGGSLTIKFDRPVLNHPLNRFGIDFIIFGNSGFVITNAFDPNTFDWIGTPATDGSLFGNNTGTTRVSVSEDGVTFYILNPPVARTVDGLLPTDGAADFHTPADPALTAEDFAGLTLEQMRLLYHGSAGGTGYDISWAQDDHGRLLRLGVINFLRLEVLSGKSEVDGFASVFAPPGRKRQ